MGGETTAAREGVEAIHRQLLSLLKAQGVTAFDTLGESFNPELHEAVGSAPNDQYKPGSVAEEVRRGYRWGGELLRPSRVRVAR
jgi:molecular chaperone GrpE